jgi:Zn-dependent protease
MEPKQVILIVAAIIASMVLIPVIQQATALWRLAATRFRRDRAEECTWDVETESLGRKTMGDALKERRFSPLLRSVQRHVTNCKPSPVFIDYWLSEDGLVAASVMDSYAPALGVHAHVVFLSWSSEGASKLTITTANRTTVELMESPASEAWVDAEADSLEAHLTAHRMRLPADAPPVDAAWIRERALETGKLWYGRSIAAGDMFVLPDGTLQYSLGAAFRRIRTTMSAIRRWAPRPYSLTSEANPANDHTFPAIADEIHLRALCDEVALQSAPSPGMKVWWMFFSVSLVASAAVLWIWLGWEAMLALLLVLLIHELGHWTAMRYFGYHNARIFFLPLFGAVATGDKRDATAWQETIVLLAGPLPGLVFGSLLLAMDSSELWPYHTYETVHLVALLFIAVNLFNLLPVVPLDGGKILSLHVYRRWTWMPLVSACLFTGLLAYLAWGWFNPMTAAFALFSVLWIPPVWHAMQLRKAAQQSVDALPQSQDSNVSDQEFIKRLYRVMSASSFATWSSLRKYQTAKAVFQDSRPATPTPRESFMGISMYVALSCLPLAALYLYVGFDERERLESIAYRWIVPRHDDTAQVKADFNKEYAAANTPEQKIKVLLKSEYWDWSNPDGHGSRNDHIRRARAIAHTLPPGNAARGDALLAESWDVSYDIPRLLNLLNPIIEEYSQPLAAKHVLREALAQRGYIMTPKTLSANRKDADSVDEPPRKAYRSVSERIADLEAARLLPRPQEIDMESFYRHSSNSIDIMLAIALAEDKQFERALGLMDQNIAMSKNPFEIAELQVLAGWVMAAKGDYAAASQRVSKIKNSIESTSDSKEKAAMLVNASLFELDTWIAIEQKNPEALKSARNAHDLATSKLPKAYRSIQRKPDVGKATDLLEDIYLAESLGDEDTAKTLIVALKGMRQQKTSQLRQIHFGWQSLPFLDKRADGSRREALDRLLCREVPSACNSDSGSCKRTLPKDTI